MACLGEVKHRQTSVPENQTAKWISPETRVIGTPMNN